MGRKLHIGGQVKVAGWEVLDANPAPIVDHVANARDLSLFPDNTFEKIYASHVIEHFDYTGELGATLIEWRRVLAPGGILYVSVPDLDILARLFVDRDSLSAQDRYLVMRMIFGGHADQYDYHLVGLNEEFLRQFLSYAGYVQLGRVGRFDMFDDTSNAEVRGVRISLNMTARKPVESNSGAVAPATPQRFESVYGQALTAASAQDFERALELYDQAIAIDPMHAEAHYKRGNSLKSLGRLHAAIESYDQAIKLKPDYAYAYCNRGAVQRDLGFLDQALSSYDFALRHDPLDARSHYNRALLLQDRLRWAEALESYDRAIAADPGFADAHYNRSLTLLYCGDLKRGWPGYEWRWKNASRLGLGEERGLAQPLWLGAQSLVGKRLLLHGEGGLGDMLQFCRYAPLVAKLGATVYLEVPKPLAALLVDLEGVTQLIVKGSPLPDFDYHCPLMSLPLAFDTTLDSIPAALNYLHADEAKVRRWAERLQTLPRPWVGLAWSGNPNNPIDQRRSMSLTELMTHLPAQVHYFRLQKNVRSEDQAALDAHPNIFPIEDDQLDFVSTAALAECMDIVISVDTSVAHLSAALGKRTWIMLPFVADWRWLRDRDDSAWYPSAKLYRQKMPGDWGPVLDRIAGDLRREFRIE